MYVNNGIPEGDFDRRFLDQELRNIADSVVELQEQIDDMAKNYFLEVAAGNIPGVSHINKFGGNLTIAADTTEDIWDGGGDYIYPATADITHVHQNVDQVAMRGETIEVEGLDANWGLSVEVIALGAADTTVLQELVTPLIRIFRMKVLANVAGDQDIHATNVGETINYATMAAGNNQTLMALYTVPAGKTAYLTNYYASQTDAATKTPTSTGITLWAADRANGYAFQLKHAVGIPEAGGMVNHRFEPYAKATEKTDIRISAKPIDQDGNVAAGFDLILVDNE